MNHTHACRRIHTNVESPQSEQLLRECERGTDGASPVFRARVSRALGELCCEVAGKAEGAGPGSLTPLSHTRVFLSCDVPRTLPDPYCLELYFIGDSEPGRLAALGLASQRRG
jgi:hypothetical protein